MKRYSLILLFFTFLSFVLFWPIFLGKVNLNGNLLVSFYAPYGENLPYKNTGWDQLRIYFPFYKVTLEQLKNFKLPLWNPYAFSGHPHLADFQTAVFYPLNLFGLFLPQIEFWHFLRLTPTILASVFTYLYLAGALKLPKIPSIFGAITFGFGPFILTWGEEVVMSPHSIIWLPLILYAIDKYIQSRGKKFLVLISASTAFSFFGGYIQTSIYMFIFILGYLVFRLELKNLFTAQKALWLGAAFLFGMTISAIQLLPSAELYFNSARATVTLRQTLFAFLLPPEAVLTALAPDFFGNPATHNFIRRGSAQYYEGIIFVGVAALIFAAFAVVAKGKDRLVMFLAVASLIALSLALDLPTSRLFLSLPIPFLSSSIANRVLFIPAFCISVIAAIGMARWQEEGDKRILKVIIFFGFLYSVIIFYLLGAKYLNLPYFKPATLETWQAATVSLRNLVIPLGVFLVTGFLILGATLTGKYKRYAAVLIVVLGFTHIFYFSQKYLSFSDRKNIFPDQPALDFIKKNQGYLRSWSIGQPIFTTNFASQYSIFWPEGYDSLNNRAYSEFTYAMQGNRLSDFVQRADAGLGAVGSADELLANNNRRRLMDMVGVKYLLAKKSDAKAIERYNFKKVFPPSHEASTLRSRATAEDGSEGNFVIFENLQVLPRAFLAPHWEGPPAYYAENLTTKEIDKIRRKLIINKLLSDDFDFRNAVVLEQPSPISPQAGEGSVEIISYKPQEVVVKTKADQPKLLFLSDNYYPGWKAEVDGDETEILRANYTFRAVSLVPAEHTVRFYYDSDVFKVGLFVSVASIGVLALLTLRRNRLLG